MTRRNSPRQKTGAGPVFRQRDQMSPGGVVLGQLPAMGVDEDIGVDRDHARPSMRS